MIRAVVAVAAAGCSALALSVAVPATGAASRASARTTRVTVVAREFSFKLSRRSVPRGTVIFTVVNRGRVGHDFKIARRKTRLIAPRKRATLKVVFRKKGRYLYVCTVPGHAAAGMKGRLVVRAS